MDGARTGVISDGGCCDLRKRILGSLLDEVRPLLNEKYERILYVITCFRLCTRTYIIHYKFIFLSPALVYLPGSVRDQCT